MTSDPVAFITQNESKYPQFASFWTNARKFIERKLWHQLTIEIQALFINPEFKKNSTLCPQDVFISLIEPLSESIDQYTYVTFTLQVCNTLSNENNYEKQFELLEKIKKNVPKTEFDAHLLIDTTIAYYLVINDQVFKAMDLLIDVESRIDNSSRIVNNLSYFQLHKAFALVEKKRGQHMREFSRKLLMLSFATTTDTTTTTTTTDQQQQYDNEINTFDHIVAFTPQEQAIVATEIAISALLSSQIYNFGEVLSHNTVRMYTPDALKAMLEVYQRGELENFEKVFQNATNLLPIEQKSTLYRKLQVIRLLNTVFVKPAPQRTFALSELTTIVNAKDEIDLYNIIIYAFGVNVLKGQIDAINKTVTFTWVQPRLLNQQQLVSLQTAISESVKHTNDTITNVFTALSSIDNDNNNIVNAVLANDDDGNDVAGGALAVE